MIDQTDQDQRFIEEGAAIREMIATDGWKIVEKMLDLKCETVRAKRDMSDDASIVMACVRQEDGIMYIKEVIKEFIELGDQAAQRC